jgi:hypothetical protein
MSNMIANDDTPIGEDFLGSGEAALLAGALAGRAGEFGAE